MFKFKKSTYNELTNILSLMRISTDSLEEDIDYMLNECDEEDDLGLFYSMIEDRIFRLRYLYSEGEKILKEED